MAGFAEELRRIPMSQGLGATLARAADYAQAQQHGEVALEHLLLALTEDDDAMQVLAASHVDLAQLKADVSSYLGGLDHRGADGGQGRMALAIDLKRILEAAAAAANQGRRREINGAIVLAAIVGDGRSSAAHMLRAQGLTFEEAIKALQRALSGVPQPVPVAKPDAEDIIATARARVQNRAAPGLPPRVDMPAPAVLVDAAPEFQAMPERGGVAEIAPWPPEVRASHPVEAVRADPRLSKTDFDLIQSEIDGSREGDTFAAEARADEEAAAQAYEQAVREEAAFAQAHEPVRYPEPPALPPMVSAGGPPPTPLKPIPQPGSRWPAPVAPAWKDQPEDRRRAIASGRGAGDAPHELGYSGPPPLPSYTPAPPPPPAHWGDGAGMPPPPVPHQPSAEAWPGAHFADQPPPPQLGYNAGAAGGAAFDAGNQFGWPQAHEMPPQDWGPPPVAAGEPEWTDAPGLAQVVPGNELAAPVAANVPARRRKAADRALGAQLAEGLPRRLKANSATTIDVRLGHGELASLLDGLAEDGGRNAALGSLSVKLRAPDGRILIEPSSPETHWMEPRGALVADGASVVWQWTVTPLKPGRRKLQLVMWARSASPDGTAVVTPLPDQTVEVRVGRDWGRAFGRLTTWVVLIGAGWLAATYGGAVYGPVLAQVAKLLK